MSTDQRWYLAGPYGPEGQWLNEALTIGRTYEGPTPLTCRVHHSGPQLELTVTEDIVPVVNERVAEIFARYAGKDAQLIPARASESDANLWAVNVLPICDCIDEARSAGIRRYTPEDGEPDRVGQYKAVYGYRIDPARAGAHTILRPKGYEVVVVVNEDLALALQHANVRCELKLVS
ncbi:MAG TPA: hypothetical protein VFA20_21300 [Myxococcaceae bacterium]|nr:hypothetical protein [Myxococcaceae bacterium]